MRRLIRSTHQAAHRNVSTSSSCQAESFANGTNANYVEQMYLSWKEEPTSVHVSWSAYFKNVEEGRPPGAAFQSPLELSNSLPLASVSSGNVTSEIKKNQALKDLIQNYQNRGHYRADLDPLGISEGPKSFRATHMTERECVSVINPDPVLDGRDEEMFIIPDGCYIGKAGEQKLPLKEIKRRLEDAYCDTIGVDAAHIASNEEKDWIKRKFEAQHSLADKEQQRLTLSRLIRATKFEEFLAKKWVSEKRFGIEGLEMTIPMMKTVIDEFAGQGADSFVIGMPHRGRLNVLANVVRAPLDKLFSQFDPSLEAQCSGQSGDVKYHLGFSHETENHATKRPITVQLLANPSHLEVVGPVAIGKAKAKQDERRDERGQTVVPLVLHGDAAFAGQGIVYETLHLSHLTGFDVGGAIHIVCNNQIGFTTDPRHSRSTAYCTDVARVVNAPIFHVNADDPDACFFVAKIAAEFRQTFHSDVVIDLIGYRRHGHNEIDEPMFTQPRMYQVISKHQKVLDIYSEKLKNAGVVTKDEIEQVEDEYEKILEDALKKEKTMTELDFTPWVDSPWPALPTVERESLPVYPATGVDRSVLQKICDAISTEPADIKIHKGLKRALKMRRELGKQGMADWGMGESFGYGSLLVENVPVRLTGQDVERGTFSHRQHVLHCQKEDKKIFLPMMNISQNQATYTVRNSALSEYASLAFEYGYSKEGPISHTVWEAQFGDFVNTAQCVLDQFLSSGETKWGTPVGLTVHLPHGYEGMGPEHSSSRVERYLQMQNDDPDSLPDDWQQPNFATKQLSDANWFIANPTTPANCFHLHRRQVKLPFRKPLIILTPKSLLRLPEARSDWSEMETGTSFRRTIPEEGAAAKNPDTVKRLMFCSGKIYYELVKERAARGMEDTVAIARIEQLAPFPYDEVKPEIAKFANAQLYWVQEEHKNMGFYDFAAQRLRTASDHKRQIHYAGRESAAAAATGSKQNHKKELKDLMEAAFRHGAKNLL